MAEAQGRIRISLSFDTSGADRGVKSVAESFRRLSTSAKRALRGTSLDGVQDSAKGTTDAIRGIRDEMDDMSAAEARAAAALAKQLAVVDGLVAQINEADSKTNATLASLSAQQQTLEDNIRRTTAAASELQTKWDQIDQSIKRDRTTGDILPGQDDKIAQLDKLGNQMADLDAKTRSYQARLDALKTKIQSVNESKLGADGTRSALETKLAAAEAQADALRNKLYEVQQARNTALGGGIGKAGGIASSIGSALGSGLRRAGATAKSVFGSIPGYAKRSFAKISSMGAPVTRLFERIGRSAREVFVIGAILGTLRGARDILGSIVEKDSKISGQLSTIKGNLMAAFSPLWQKVYPAVTAILNVLVAITSAIANLSAKLFGGAVSSTSALYGEAEAIGAVGGAAASASKELGAFDEINQVDDSKGGSGGGSGSGGTTGGLLTDLSWTMQDLYDKLMAINWELVAGRINDALLGIDFVAIGSAINTGVKYIIGALSDLLEGIDWAQLGSNIASGMNEMLSDDVLPDLAGLLADWFNAKIRLFYGFVTTFDWVGLGKSIGQSINRFFSDLDWDKLGIGLNSFGRGVLDALLEALVTTDWEQIGKKIATAIRHIDWRYWTGRIKDIIVEALKAIGTIALTILAELTDIDIDTDSDTLKMALGGALALLLGGTFSLSKGGLGLGKFVIAAGLLLGFSIVTAIDEAATKDAYEQVGRFLELPDEYSSFNAMLADGKINIGSYTEALQKMGYGITDAEELAERMFSSIEKSNAAYTNGALSVDVFRDVLISWGLTAEQADRRIAELNATTQSLAVQFANGEISVETYKEGLIELGYSAETADAFARNLANGFTDIDTALAEGSISVAEYIDAFVSLGGRTDEAIEHLTELGYSVDDIETSMGNTETSAANAADSISDMGTAAETAEETTSKMSDSMSDAAESAQDMADSTETVADNSADAEKAVKGEAKTLAKAEGNMDDAAEASEDLGTAAGDMADTTSDGIISMDTALQDNLSGWQRYASMLTGIMTGIAAQQTAFWAQMSTNATEATNSIKASFTSLGAHMTSTISGAWKSVVAALSSGGSSFEAITGGINTVIRSALNGVITGLNNVFRSTFTQLNNVLGRLRGTRVGGALPFGAIRPITIPQIPKLAQGAVIPANHEFLAILGDQKRGTNVEAPLDTITDAMLTALQRAGAMGASPEAIAAAVRAALSDMTVQFDREQVGRIIARTIDDNRRADGKFAYDLA